MANVTVAGASYQEVPAVELPLTGGGTVLFYEAIDGNNMAFGTSSCLVGTARVGTAYAWTDYQGDNIAIINRAIVGTDAVV